LSPSFYRRSSQCSAADDLRQRTGRCYFFISHVAQRYKPVTREGYLLLLVFAKHCDEYFRPFVGSSFGSYNTKTTPPVFIDIFVHIVNGRVALVLLRRRCDTLCTSGFVDDVMFSRGGPMARHVYS